MTDLERLAHLCLDISLYDEGGYYDKSVSLEMRRTTGTTMPRIATCVGEIYASASVHRPLPSYIGAPETHFVSEIINYYTTLNGVANRVAPCRLYEVAKVAIWQNLLFVEHEGRLVPAYEMLRDADSSSKGGGWADKIRQASSSDHVQYDGFPPLFLGSAGSSNYGHWLVDDLTRLKALDLISQKNVVLLTSLGPQIDRARIESITRASNSPAVNTVFVPKDKVVHFDHVYFVSPSSVHPRIKNPHAIQFLAQRAGATLGSGSRRLYIGRPRSTARHVVNEDAMLNLLEKFYYESIRPDELPVEEQWSIFKDASHVIGVMGAAMTNTVFSARDARLLYLAPAGWNEPFYWDLASMRGQSYSALFGVSEGVEASHLRKFEIDLDELEKVLDLWHS